MTTPLVQFVTESNRIENIHREPTIEEVAAHACLLALNVITVGDLEMFVECVARARLRRRVGQNVIVGGHRPPPGGVAVELALTALLATLTDGVLTPWETHVQYQSLHPFTDGNGRSGRALWVWHMRRERFDPFYRPFLHEFYYQTLSAAR